MTTRYLLPQLAAATAMVLCLIGPTCAFMSTPQLSTNQCIRPTELPMIKQDDEPEISEESATNLASSRRQFFAKVAATAAAPIFLGSTEASAVTNEPTRIELVVDTEYLIRVLEYFDGDMRKVLATLVRSPQTTVEIDPPARGTNPNLSPEDAILRALYSYNSPEDYAEQASWLKIDKPNKGFIRGSIDFLTKKRYTIYLPQIDGSGNIEVDLVAKSVKRDLEGGKKNVGVSFRPTNLKLSNLEGAVGLGAISYPLAYSYYNYESYQEEQAAKLKKAQMAAKKAAKAKAAAAKKSKGTPKKEAAENKADVKKKQPPAVKGQEAKKEVGEKAVPTKKAKKDLKEKPETLSVEEKVAAEMLDSQREKFIESAEKKAVEEKVAAEMLDSKRENFIASTEQDPGQDAVTAADADQSEASSEAAPTGTNLRALAENVKPKKGGPFNNYLDSL